MVTVRPATRAGSELAMVTVSGTVISPPERVTVAVTMSPAVTVWLAMVRPVGPFTVTARVALYVPLVAVRVAAPWATPVRATVAAYWSVARVSVAAPTVKTDGSLLVSASVSGPLAWSASRSTMTS